LIPRTADATDPVLTCSRFQGRLASGDTAQLGADVLAFWQQPARMPRECDGVFSWLRSQNLITAAAAEARSRAALAADNARLGRDAALDVPAPRQDALLLWARLLEVPRPAIEDLVSHPDASVEAEALVGGFKRLSRTDAVTASNLLSSLQSRAWMTPALYGRLQRLVALGLAYDHSPSAVAAFQSLPAEVVDNDVDVWRLRAALWSHNFSQALAWIHELPDALATQPRWRYWQGRATEQVRGRQAAVPVYEQIAGSRDFYGYLAADRLQHDYRFNDHPSLDDAEAQRTLAAAPGMIRAHELFACDLQDDAMAEWAQVLINAEPATRVQAAHLATRWGWYNQAIVTLAQSGQWDDLDLRYPHPYAQQVQQASARMAVSGDWIYAVMRQESLFRRDATSRADARGLMQLQPATAVALAKRAHLPVPNGASLYDPNVSIVLGAAYINELFERYQGELAQTLAAYNAGSWAVTRWQPPVALDADIWVENIPYNETRNYVQHVMEHIEAYARDHAPPPPRMSAYLAPIDPANAAATAAAAPAGDPPLPR
jgi:soluble lytic murein transglycosylase